MSKEKAIVLLSSGLDSTVNFYESLKVYDISLALTFNYGQKAFEKEKEKSKAICEMHQVEHKVIDLPWLSDVSTSSSLTNSSKEIPTDSVDINSLKSSQESAKSVWVSNRNGLFINVAACFAEQLEAQYIIVGFNKEEAQTFPDNSSDFITSINSSLQYSTQNKVKVKSFTIDMDKKEIVLRGQELGVDYNLIWPCYFNGEELCGNCESCKRYLNALEQVSN